MERGVESFGWLEGVWYPPQEVWPILGEVGQRIGLGQALDSSIDTTSLLPTSP